MQTTKPSCYVASPCGFSESTKPWYYDTLLPLLRKYVEVHDPWEASLNKNRSARKISKEEWIGLGLTHYKDIRETCQLVVAILDQEPPDNGTVCEVVWAAAHAIPVLGFRGDVRGAGEQGLPYNLMIGAAIEISGGTETNTLEELEAALQSYAAKASRATLEAPKASSHTDLQQSILKALREAKGYMDIPQLAVYGNWGLDYVNRAVMLLIQKHLLEINENSPEDDLQVGLAPLAS